MDDMPHPLTTSIWHFKWTAQPRPGKTSSVVPQVPAVSPAESDGRHDVSINIAMLFAKASLWRNHELVNLSSVERYSLIAHQLMGFVLLLACGLLETARTVIT